MQTTKLSIKGQVVIPKAFRTAYHWEAGLELVAIDTGDGILLQSKVPFEASTLDDVAGCLPVWGKAKSLDEMDAAIRQRLKNEWRDCD